MESLELSVIAGEITTLEYEQYLLELNISPVPLESHSLLYTNTDECYVFGKTCTHSNVQGSFIWNSQ